MKHPALTRIICVVLSILCLTMLAAGTLSAAAAIKERTKAQADLERLTDRIAEYREIRKALEGKESYQDARLALKEQQSQHDEQASQHKMDLAIYTATRGGILTGKQALWQAEGAFLDGKAQYEAGVEQFKEQEAAFWAAYQQFQDGKRQLEEGKKTLALAEATVAGVRAQVQSGRSMAAILDSDDENARQELSLAAYDGLLQALDGAMQFYDLLEDQGGISPEQMQLIAAMLTKDADPELSEQMQEISWQGISAESLQEIEGSIVAMTGMTPAQIRSKIQQERDHIAAMDGDEPISEAEFALIQAQYSQSRLLLVSLDSAIEAKLSEYEAQLSESRAQLEEAQAQIDMMEPVLEQGKIAIEQARAGLDLAGEQIEAGEAGLAEGRRQLTQQENELLEKERKLRQEKSVLDSEALDLLDKLSELELQQDLEKQETSVRLMLLERDGIQDRVDRGMELLPAAEDFADETQRLFEGRYRVRLIICALMALGALFGLLDIPAAFEKTKSRFCLIAPVLLCLGLAAAAETLCRLNGRGDSYSALAVCVFALVQLLLVIPKKKKV